MRQFRFSSSTVGGSEVGSIRRNLRRSVYVSVDMANVGHKLYPICPSDLFATSGDRSISAVLVVLISCNNSIFLFSVSSYCFGVPKSLYRVLVIYPFSRSSVVLSLAVFHSCLLAYCLRLPRSNSLSIGHYVAFTITCRSHNRRAVARCGCSLFTCDFFVD